MKHSQVFNEKAWHSKNIMLEFIKKYFLQQSRF